MLTKSVATPLLALSSLVSHAAAVSHKQWSKRSDHLYLPKEVDDYKTATAPNNVTIRYKNPGICETTPGVESYSGYVDLTPDVHVFFWFFESRNDPASDPFTLWLNGGPGSDSLIGLFEENGPCMIDDNLTAVYNPYSWNNVSNMLYISQPVGTGFSYQKQGVGSFNPFSEDFHYNSTEWPATGRWPLLEPLNKGTIDTTDLAAVATWHVFQALLATIPKFDAKLGALSPARDFNLFTESYGGHYGPSFFTYFYNQNLKIQNGSMPGYQMNFNSLGIINGIIDESVQAGYYPEFAVNNTYGIKAYNDTVYSYAKFANNMYNGCLYQIALCRAAAEGNTSYYHVDAPITQSELTPGELQVCNEAADMCRDNVESPYYYYSGRGVYDIRHPYNDPTPPSNYPGYLNQAEIQDALGVTLNYSGNNGIYYAFQNTGDFIYPNFRLDLEYLLDQDVRVSLAYGDADYICNWFGGEAISLAMDYTHSKEFQAAGYEAMVVDGTEYGEVRQYGNFSFARIYESGHEVPYYQPVAALAYFNRTLYHYDIATGEEMVSANLTTSGPANATHTNSFVPLTSSVIQEFPSPIYPTATSAY
ncbi:carboxypeptidase s1 [Stemphylium lycopersici]|uniref:Carboxypeptidase n=1 Tax=Stemphylium lycopersici TaxID=183478 RepID=A0A364N7D2_STELY|nr:carboxypeptidase s1 [Stemphylium lycopersici]RAR02349.1 carboxypeptidase s1 [Stemphylium lycopersici]RAR13176.1 carboxypeptidase s1 [Stemphylium lycopersici]